MARAIPPAEGAGDDVVNLAQLRAACRWVVVPDRRFIAGGTLAPDMAEPEEVLASIPRLAAVGVRRDLVASGVAGAIAGELIAAADPLSAAARSTATTARPAAPDPPSSVQLRPGIE